MRTCSKCGAANQPTRKFCIRCGASLLVPIEEKPKAEARQTPPKPEVPELGRVVTGKSVQAQKKAAAAATETTQPQTPSVTTQDQWVRPSSVPRDRIRKTDTSRGKSEMEKAKEIFAKAMEYGTDEEGTGVIETRMLRASEVRELLSTAAQEETAPAPPPSTPATARPPRAEPEEASLSPARAAAARAAPVETAPPTRAASPPGEERVLGPRSSFVRPPSMPPEEEIEDTESMTPEMVQGFTSSRYGGGGGAATATVVPSVKPVTATRTPRVTAEETEMRRAEAALQEDVDNVTVCPKCGTVITRDSFEYTPEIFSAMGEARLKQARFFVVQGQYEQATKTLAIAKALFTKAGDEGGISMVNKLADSLTRGGR